MFRSHITIGAFPDAKHFVELLRKSTLPAERDRLVRYRRTRKGDRELGLVHLKRNSDVDK